MWWTCVFAICAFKKPTLRRIQQQAAKQIILISVIMKKGNNKSGARNANRSNKNCEEIKIQLRNEKNILFYK